MTPKFGTSGLRGLVTGLTPALVADHVRAYLASCETGGTVHVGRDLRPSSPGIARVVIDTVRQAGLQAIDCGALPTPALALAATGAGAIMVTGSHIPADRNGLKFYTTAGEITKADEAAITAALGLPPAAGAGPLLPDEGAAGRYAARYLAAFGPGALTGRRIGVWEHSSVARDLIGAVLEGLGADVVRLGRAADFVPVDTEAVDPETRALLAGWVAGLGLDALVSTDGDADRPLLTDETGRVVAGDMLGQIASATLGARVLVTPVSSNSGADLGGFGRVIRTKIGSPFVIAAMEAALAADPAARLAGYEANGGYLLGFTATPASSGGALVAALPALLTRDSLLPVLAALVAARGGPVSARVAAEPPRVTAAGRLQQIPVERSRALLAGLADPGARADLLAGIGAGAKAETETETGLDLTDGLRITLASGAVLHLRPSGNAPEFRVYTEADSPGAAAALLSRSLDLLARRLG